MSKLIIGEYIMFNDGEISQIIDIEPVETWLNSGGLCTTKSTKNGLQYKISEEILLKFTKSLGKDLEFIEILYT